MASGDEDQLAGGVSRQTDAVGRRGGCERVRGGDDHSQVPGPHFRYELGPGGLSDLDADVGAGCVAEDFGSL
jgi:hypothetical protein